MLKIRIHFLHMKPFPPSFQLKLIRIKANKRPSQEYRDSWVSSARQSYWKYRNQRESMNKHVALKNEDTILIKC